MPRIINAYDGNSAIGSSLAKLGESIFGDQAKNEVYRQKAKELTRGNDNAQGFADSLKNNDSKGALYYGALGNHTGQDVGDFNRARAATFAGGNVDSPDLATAYMGAGGNFAATAPGQGRANASAERIGAGNNKATIDAQHIASDRAAETQLAIDGRTLTNVDNGDGTAHYETKSNAASGHMAVPVTKEGVLGAMLRKYAAGNAPTDVAAASPNAPVAPAAPQGNPFAAIPPQVQHVLGVGMPPQSMVHPQTGQTGVSYDGGQNIVDGSGRTIPATGFLPVGQEAALGQARDNNVRKQASAPLVVPTPANSAAAADASRSSGLGPALGTDLNHTFGAIPGAPSVFQGAFGSPQIAPGVQDARQNQDIRNNQARAVLLGAPGRQTTQAQKWVNELLPQGDAFSNPATEAAKIPKIVGALQGDWNQLQTVATDPNTLPADRVKVTQQMRQIENTIRLYTEPPAPTAGAQPQAAAATTPQAAPTAGAPPAAAAPTQTATGPGGKKLGLINGQWVPM